MGQLCIDVDAEERARVARMVADHSGFFHAEFPAWLAENFSIWLRFEAEANRVRRMRGRTHYSAYTIVEYLRHHTLVEQASGELKINNNVVASLARLYVLMHPSAYGFFEFRVMKSKGAALGIGEPVAA